MTSTFLNLSGKIDPLTVSALRRIEEPCSPDRSGCTLRSDKPVDYFGADQLYLGLCAEFPALSWLAETPEAALKGIRKVVAEGVTILEADGDPIPKPLSNKKFSGKFSVRIPPEVHRNLSIQAAEEGISLNRLISSKLT